MFQEELKLVPNKPGCYQMYNKDNDIIYVGKAKDLKKRISSYFNRQVRDKTKVLVSEISHFEYIVTSTELEAFILEINLIKKYKPKYNVLLTDDKSYPYIEYRRYPFPSLRVVRYLKVKKDKDSKLFGPFPNSYAARRVVNLINRIYPLKKCVGMPKQVCLYYHIGECLGYCVMDVPKSKIDEMEQDIIRFLSGNDKIITDKIMERINYHSENMNYEVAKELTEELDYIKIVLDKQKVELKDLENRDVINYYENDSYVSLVIFFIRHGKLLEAHKTIFNHHDNVSESIEEYLALFYENHEIPKEIIISENLNPALLKSFIDTNFVIPKKGDKKSILNLVKENAKIHLESELEKIKIDNKRTIDSNEELRLLLDLPKLIKIESFDNSNLFGNYSVSGMVVFINGKPNKNLYRKYKIEVDSNDDYQMMKEVIYRRYYRVLMEKSELPDLIIVDGGLNQVNAALSTLNDLGLSIRVIGLKKNKYHQTEMIIDGLTKKEIKIDKTSDLFHYLTRIQDETHRFTIYYHRKLRSKGNLASILDEVPGLGAKRKKVILENYPDLKMIKEVNIAELSKLIPSNVAIKLKELIEELFW